MKHYKAHFPFLSEILYFLSGESHPWQGGLAEKVDTTVERELEGSSIFL